VPIRSRCASCICRGAKSNRHERNANCASSRSAQYAGAADRAGHAQLGSTILTEASLSFLGLGIPEPYPSWGRMLSESAAEYVRTAPWLVIFPGVAISLAVFGTNLFGDALRDISTRGSAADE